MPWALCLTETKRCRRATCNVQFRWIQELCKDPVLSKKSSRNVCLSVCLLIHNIIMGAKFSYLIINISLERLFPLLRLNCCASSVFIAAVSDLNVCTKNSQCAHETQKMQPKKMRNRIRRYKYYVPRLWRMKRKMLEPRRLCVLWLFSNTRSAYLKSHKITFLKTVLL